MISCKEVMGEKKICAKAYMLFKVWSYGWAYKKTPTTIFMLVAIHNEFIDNGGDVFPQIIVPFGMSCVLFIDFQFKCPLNQP
jgi:hypothetical protein